MWNGPAGFVHSWWWLGPALSVVLGAALTYCLRWLRQRRRSKRAKAAIGAEVRALELLRARGYTVLDTQVRQVWPVCHGVRQLEFTLRADAVVRRANATYVAEVKSSSFVADLKHGPTRRQLLEYALAYGADGVLLVDMHAQRIEEVTFPRLVHAPERQRSVALVACVVSCLLAFLVGVWLGFVERA